MNLTHMSDSIRLNLVVRQVQGSVGLTHMQDPIYLDLIVSQVQG
jgi:hypothetical protein